MSFDEQNLIYGGESLLGFGDHPEAYIGAMPRKPPISTRASGGSSSLPSNTIYGPAKKPKPSAVPGQHAQTMKVAKTTAKKVVQAALNAAKAARTTPKKPLVKPQLAKPGLKTHLGADAKPLSDKAKKALDKQKEVATKAGVAAQKAAAAALNAKKSAIELAKKIKAQRTASVEIRRKGKTRVRGIDLMGNVEIGEEVRAIFDQYYTAVGAAPDPNNPGFLDDGSPDPAFFGTPTDSGSMADMPTDMDLGGSDVLETQLGPPLPPDARIADMNAVGGIPYDGSKGHPPGYIGSRSYFYQTIVNPKYAERRYGFVFGGDPHNSDWPGNNFDKWVWVHGKKGDSGSIPDFPGQESGVSGWWDNADNVNPSYSDTANVHKASIAKGYGVIMGNPAFPDFTGLRVDDAGNLFWLPQEAPEWLMAPLKAAAEQTAKAERDAAAAAKAAEQAAMEKVQSDAALAQAQQDAANALAESKAASEQNIAQAQMDTQSQQMQLAQQQAEQQQATQQAQLEMQTQQQTLPLMVQQAQMEQQQQAALMQQQQQVNQMMVEQARMEQEYAAQHPELMFQQQPSDEGGEEESGDEYVDEGAEAYGDE